ncbi:N-acetyltransferase [Nocardia vinacea]|uniref:N-acetyltransferase n=1 Tax=Nocardia vinacea TaxID=96468 RepID=A0ABZ1YQS0_9NOCA|nr:GNAT family N-acetyltransferase [Nocardia vinacea]
MTSPAVQRGDDCYEIRVDGERAGFTAFFGWGNRRIFYDTEIDDAFEGKGLGTILIERALADARRPRKRVVPLCRAVADYLKRSREFADITDPITEDIIASLDTKV